MNKTARRLTGSVGLPLPGCVRGFRILEADFAVGAELTPTQKVRRHYVLGKYATDIDALYTGGQPCAGK